MSANKNLVSVLAANLGVELGEEFELKYNNQIEERRFYKFELDGLKACDASDRNWWRDDMTLWGLISGECSVVKRPFKPKFHEVYYRYANSTFDVIKADWGALPWEFALLLCGCIFRTAEEAIAARPQKHKELTGQEWKVF